MTPEELQLQARNRIKQLREDIAELEARRDNIQKEVDIFLNNAKLSSDDRHAARMAQLETEYQKKKAVQDGRQGYLDDFMFRLDNHATEQSVRNTILSEKESELRVFEDRLLSEKADFIKAISDADGVNKKERNAIDQEWERLKIHEKGLLEREASIDVSNLSIKDKENAAALKEQHIQSLIEKNEVLLKSISEREEALKTEQKVVNESLDVLEKEKVELIKLSAIKDDLVLLEQAYQDHEKEKELLKVYSKQIEARDRAVTEKEQTNLEREKYLVLMSNELSKKIDILQKLRQANVV